MYSMLSRTLNMVFMVSWLALWKINPAIKIRSEFRFWWYRIFVYWTVGWRFSGLSFGCISKMGQQLEYFQNLAVVPLTKVPNNESYDVCIHHTFMYTPFSLCIIKMVTISYSFSLVCQKKVLEEVSEQSRWISQIFLSECYTLLSKML